MCCIFSPETTEFAVIFVYIIRSGFKISGNKQLWDVRLTLISVTKKYITSFTH